MMVSRIVNSFTYSFLADNVFQLIEIKIYFFWENGHLPAFEKNPCLPIARHSQARATIKGIEAANPDHLSTSLLNILLLVKYFWEY